MFFIFLYSYVDVAVNCSLLPCQVTPPSFPFRMKTLHRPKICQIECPKLCQIRCRKMPEDMPKGTPERILGCFRLQGPYLGILYPIRISGSPGSPSFRILYRTLAQNQCFRISTRSMTAGTLQNPCPRQDPCVRIHVGTSTSVGSLDKIHVSTSISQDPMQNPCLQISQHPYLYPRLRIHVSASTPLGPLKINSCKRATRSMVSELCLSIPICGPPKSSIPQGSLQDPRLRILCKIHVSGSMSQHPYLKVRYTRSMSPDSCLRIYASTFLTVDSLQDPCLRILCKIHVFGPSTKFMSPGWCLRIYVSQSLVVDPIQDPCLRVDPIQDPCLRALHQIHVSGSQILRTLYKIHASKPLSQHPHLRIRSCLHTRVSASISVDSLPGQSKSTRRFSESDSTGRKPAEGWTQSKSTPRYNESDSTRTKPAEGQPLTQHAESTGAALQQKRSDMREPRTARKKCITLNTNNIPPVKQTRRYSESGPTRRKSAGGCICKHEIGAPERDAKNQSSNHTLTSASQHEIRFQTSSCNCHAKIIWRPSHKTSVSRSWKQKITEYCAGQQKGTFFTTTIREQPLRRFCRPREALMFCTFPVSENRHGS